MRDIPPIVKELKEYEIQKKSGFSDLKLCDNIESLVQMDSMKSCNKMLFNEELKRLNRESYGFQNLNIFLRTCLDFLEMYPEPVIIIDSKGIIMFVNQRFLSLVGFVNEEVIGSIFFSSPFFSIKNEQNMIKHALESSNQIQQTPYEMMFQTKQREHHTGLVHINSIKDLNDEIIGLIITITDITKLKVQKDEIDKLNQFQKSIIENENIWFSICDLSSNVMMWNTAAERISGYSKKEVIGSNRIWDWLKPDSSTNDGFVTTKGFTKINNTIVSEDFETIIKRKDGSNRVISWSPRMFYDQFNNPVGTIAIGKDITHRKQNEQRIKDQNKELIELNKNLEEKVEERTQKIRDLLDQKNDFINQLGHDLKTPLTPLMALLPIIQQEMSESDKKEIVDVLIRNTTYMKDLITKTIELAKLNSDMVPLNIIAVNLYNEVEVIKQNNMMLFEERYVTLNNHVQQEVFVEADSLRLREILLNLVTNAVYYSKEEGGAIDIYADCSSEMVTISVKDTGIGMAEDQLKKVFDEFYKADESRHHLNSSGLGLNIAKRLVEKHGGKIWAESEGVGMGSTFIFTLKRAHETKSSSQDL